ncbi:MAG: hypothetical protein HY599_05440 [Candidatus Omnitrophica bacterium]|nr:hypothetical protein [Candidatus Omnitrophota bacterium]
MRKLVGWALAASLVMTAAPVYAGQGGAGENIMTKTGDWFATMGKSETERTAVLAQRRAARAARQAQHEAEKSAKKAEKSMQGAAKEMNKGLKDITGQ